MMRALDAGQLAEAVLDVTDPEPLPEADPLWSHPCVHITPQKASSHGSSPPRCRCKGLAQQGQKGRCARTSPEAGAQHGDDVGSRKLPARKHPLEPACCHIGGNVPLRPHRDALPGQRPIAHHRAVVAAHGGADADGLGLARSVRETPERHVLVVLSDHQALQLRPAPVAPRVSHGRLGSCNESRPVHDRRPEGASTARAV